MNKPRVALMASAGLMGAMLCGCTASQPRTVEAQPVATRDPVALSQLRERALDELVAASASEYALERANAIEGLQYAPSRLEPIAAAALMDPNEGVRSVAATVIGQVQLRTLAGAVRPLLADASPFVVASAIYAIDRTGGSVDPSPLGRFLFDGASAKVRAHAAFILGEMGQESALPMLSDAARSTETVGSSIDQRLLELQIAEAMIKLGDRAKLDTVRAALLPATPDDLEATALAAQIIGKVQDRQSIDRLIFLSAQRDQRGATLPPEILLAIAGGLAELRVGGAWNVADAHRSSADPSIRAQAAIVYGQTEDRAQLGKLESMLEDASPLVRIAAATGVLRMLSEQTGR